MMAERLTIVFVGLLLVGVGFANARALARVECEDTKRVMGMGLVVFIVSIVCAVVGGVCLGRVIWG